MPPIADVNLSTEAAVGLVSAVVVALSGSVGLIFRMLMKSKDEQLEAERSQKKSYMEIAREAVGVAESQVPTDKRAAYLAPVVPEHNSPQTQEQTDAAKLQTLRARVTAVTLALGLPPREAGIPVDAQEKSTEPPRSIEQKVDALADAVDAVPTKVVEKIAEQSPPKESS